LLQMDYGYAVSEISVDSGDWLAGKSLSQLRLPDEGVQVLGIRRKTGEYIGAPTLQTYVRVGDTLLAYGKREHLEDLDRRVAGSEGDALHQSFVSQMRQTILEQTTLDQRSAERA
jgi:uncharacterized protein with PhoU and TrkA domain